MGIKSELRHQTWRHGVAERSYIIEAESATDAMSIAQDEIGKAIPDEWSGLKIVLPISPEQIQNSGEHWLLTVQYK